MKKYIYVISSLIIFMSACISCSSQHSGGSSTPPSGGSSTPPSGGSSTPPLSIGVWTDTTTYAVGDKVTIHYEVNQTANLTMYGIMPNGARNSYFSNSLKNAGQYTYTATASTPQGTRTVYLQAVNAKGQSAQQTCTYQVGSPLASPNR